MSLTPRIQTVGLQADVVALTDAYSEYNFFTNEFKAALVTSRYKPNAVMNVKKKLGERLLEWWDDIVHERPDRLKAEYQAELRKEIMEELRNYEIELKTRKTIIAYRNNADVPESFERQWMSFVKLKYKVYLKRYETDMKCFLEDVCDAVDNGENFDDFMDIMEVLGLSSSPEEE